jgi:hypothetical protein
VPKRNLLFRNVSPPFPPLLRRGENGRANSEGEHQGGLRRPRPSQIPLTS